MSENDNQNTLGEDNKKIEEIGEKIDREESKEDKLQEEKQVKQKEDKYLVDKIEENEEKAQENSNKEKEEKEVKTNKSEEKKDEKEEKEEDETQKKLIKSINELSSESIRSKAIFLYDLNEDMKSQYLNNYKSEKVAIELKELDNFLNYLNKIREIINSSSKENIIELIAQENKEKYSISEKEEENNEFTPIKNFWSESLINAKFFELSEKDKKVLDNLTDIKYLPLAYPSFKIEFIFKENEYLEENTIYKIYNFQENEKDEIEKTEGCEIKWKSDDKNPTIKTVIKHRKKTKEIIKKDVDSFFNIFNTKDKQNNLDKELVEANFFRNDFLQNMLEYYLNIMEFQYNEEIDEEEGKGEK